MQSKKGRVLKRPSHTPENNKEHKLILGWISYAQFNYYYKLFGYYLSEIMQFLTGKNNPLGRLLIKLSLAMYVINYYIIRLDFFTTRVMYAITLHSVVSWIMSSLR